MRIVIGGTVQGVGFRPAVYRAAVDLGINGAVWNDGPDVVIDADRGDELVNRLLDNLPPLAKVDSIRKTESICNYSGFAIIGSSNSHGGVGIPTDTAVCDRCLAEMRSPGRRKGYAFTTCTDCGARFTLISAMPYDRDNTAMGVFRKCSECGSEYETPSNRRFHHQTVCCPVCGPRYRLEDRNGRIVDCDPIPEFAKRLGEGEIGIAKSWGGMHICATLDNVPHLRKWYRREQKPFAIMVRDIDAVKRYSRPTDDELFHLTSPHRPIVLVDKSDEPVLEYLAPGLDNIGVFLPYTGMQHLLFDSLENDALVMTSANVPGEPMILDDDDVRALGADCYLLHDQRIVNRADDSVLRVCDGRTSFIRKSRGHIPSFIPTPMKGCAVGIGAQENLTCSVASDGRVYSTQHIGNGESIGVADYLAQATNSLISTLGCEPEVIAMDLHPGYANRRYGRMLSERFGAEIVEVQHHWAHAASLLFENDADEAMVLSVDGTGYGADGNAWGGEVLRADLTSYDRVAHLQYIPLLGSDRALYDLRRLKFAIDCINGKDTGIMDDATADIMRKLMNNSVLTSSMGRLLDAVAYTLDVCKIRTYDGEPAMKIEPYLRRGHMLRGFSTETVNGEIMTAHLFDDIPDAPKADIAYSIVKTTITEMVNQACDRAPAGVTKIGLTGGVAYSTPINRMIREVAEDRGMTLITHDKVPNGDGGISVGQTAIALARLS